MIHRIVVPGTGTGWSGEYCTWDAAMTVGDHVAWAFDDFAYASRSWFARDAALAWGRSDVNVLIVTV